MAVIVFLVSFFEKALYPVCLVSNLCNCWRNHLLSVVSCIESHKKQDLELIHDYLPERLRQIVVRVGRLASIE